MMSPATDMKDMRLLLERSSVTFSHLKKSIYVLAMNLPYSFVPASGIVKVEAQSL